MGIQFRSCTRLAGTFARWTLGNLEEVTRGACAIVLAVQGQISQAQSFTDNAVLSMNGTKEFTWFQSQGSEMQAEYRTRLEFSQRHDDGMIEVGLFRDSVPLLDDPEQSPYYLSFTHFGSEVDVSFRLGRQHLFFDDLLGETLQHSGASLTMESIDRRNRLAFFGAQTREQFSDDHLLGFSNPADRMVGLSASYTPFLTSDITFHVSGYTAKDGVMSNNALGLGLSGSMGPAKGRYSLRYAWTVADSDELSARSGWAGQATAAWDVLSLEGHWLSLEFSITAVEEGFGSVLNKDFQTGLRDISALATYDSADMSITLVADHRLTSFGGTAAIPVDEKTRIQIDGSYALSLDEETSVWLDFGLLDEWSDRIHDPIVGASTADYESTEIYLAISAHHRSWGWGLEYSESRYVDGFSADDRLVGVEASVEWALEHQIEISAFIGVTEGQNDGMSIRDHAFGLSAHSNLSADTLVLSGEFAAEQSVIGTDGRSRYMLAELIWKFDPATKLSITASERYDILLDGASTGPEQDFSVTLDLAW